MGRKRSERQSYESNKPGTAGHDYFVQLYFSQRHSVAYRLLTGNQRELYIFCREQEYNALNNPSKEYPSWKAGKRKKAFFMNWGLVQEISLYRSENTFYKDLQKLIDVGLICRIFNGKPYRKKSIYTYSDRWREYEK